MRRKEQVYVDSADFQSSLAFFEKAFRGTFGAMGYGRWRQNAGRTVGRADEGGIDGVFNEGRLESDVIYIQAKRWDRTVGALKFQKFAGTLLGQLTKKVIFITTKDFTKGYERLRGNHPIAGLC